MLLAEPPPTAWDLHFQVLGFPVRVHPLFWLVGLLLGFNGRDGGNAGVYLLIWFVVLFSSILIHELGHALMIRRFGRQAHIVLYAMGGLAIEGRPRGSYEFSYEPYGGGGRARTPNEQILISAAGPGIQLLLALLIVLVVKATSGEIKVARDGWLPVFGVVLGGDMATNGNFTYLVSLLLAVNIYWPLINLLPIFPLDGGQIAQQIFVQQDPWGGTQKALWVSVVAGGAVAVLAFMGHQLFTAMLFASLAVSCYMTLQQMGGGRRPW